MGHVPTSHPPTQMLSNGTPGNPHVHLHSGTLPLQPHPTFFPTVNFSLHLPHSWSVPEGHCQRVWSKDTAKPRSESVCMCVRECVRVCVCVCMTVHDSVVAGLQYSHSPAKYCVQLLSIISPALRTRTQPIFVLSDLTQFTECSWPINLVNRRQLTAAIMDNKIT